MSAEVITRMQKSLVPTEIAQTRIRENVKIAESPALALDIFRHAPDSPGAQDYEALGPVLLKHLNGLLQVPRVLVNVGQ